MIFVLPIPILLNQLYKPIISNGKPSLIKNKKAEKPVEKGDRIIHGDRRRDFCNAWAGGKCGERFSHGPAGWLYCCS